MASALGPYDSTGVAFSMPDVGAGVSHCQRLIMRWSEVTAYLRDSVSHKLDIISIRWLLVPGMQGGAKSEISFSNIDFQLPQSRIGMTSMFRCPLPCEIFLVQNQAE